MHPDQHNYIHNHLADAEFDGKWNINVPEEKDRSLQGNSDRADGYANSAGYVPEGSIHANS